MEIRASIRKICEKCRLIRRRKRIIVICSNQSKDKDNISKKTKKNEYLF